MPKLSKKVKDILTENMRREISGACERILLRDGLESLTVEKIAKEASVAAGSIYNYFKNKDEIIKAVMENCFLELLEKIREISGKDIPADRKLHEVALFMYEDFPRVRRLHELTMHKHKMPDKKEIRGGHLQLLDLLGGIFMEGAAQGIMTVVDARFSASAFLGVIREIQFDPADEFVSLPPLSKSEMTVALFVLRHGGSCE